LVCSAVLIGFIALAAYAQDTNDLQSKLASRFAVTKMSANKADIITAGSVLVLHKDGLLMYSTDNPAPPLNTYKKGKISQPFGSGLGRGLLNAMSTGTDATDVVQRKFQADEKFWLMSCTVQPDGIVMRFISDPYDDVRYWGELKFQFAKGQVPSADEALKTVAEAITVQPSDSNEASAQPAPASPAHSAPASGAPGNATLPAITPPPPPADAPPPQPKTIAVGQTKDTLVAILGPPQKIVKLPTKEIYYYPDMKVILVKDKVTDVQ
jgi:hypothetical protein